MGEAPEDSISIKKAFPVCLQCEGAGGARTLFQELLSALSIADRLFGEVAFQFLQQYLDSTRALYQAGLEVVDFINTAEESRGKMNPWVEKCTGGTRPMLSYLGSMHRDHREHRNVPITCWIGKYKLAVRQEEQVTVVELPYTGEELSMFILPLKTICDESAGLEQLESAFTYKKVAEWINTENVYLQKIIVYLPQFRMEESCEFMPVPQALGMRDAFILKQADFLGLSREPGLLLSKAVHKSFVEVNEEGTEAAAATGVTIIPLCLHIPY